LGSELIAVVEKEVVIHCVAGISNSTLPSLIANQRLHHHHLQESKNIQPPQQFTSISSPGRKPRGNASGISKKPAKPPTKKRGNFPKKQTKTGHTSSLCLPLPAMVLALRLVERGLKSSKRFL